MLSVVIPATDNPDTLDACLAGLRRSGEPHEVTVVNDPRHRGPAAARNAGVAGTDGEIVVFVDADVVVAPDALRRLREALDRDVTLAAVFGSYDDRPAVTTQRLALSQPPASPRPRQLSRSCDDVLGRAGRDPPRGVRQRRRLRRSALPAPVDRGHRARHAAACGRPPDRAGSERARDASQALDARVDAADRLRRARRAMGRTAPRARRGRRGRAQPLLAPAAGAPDRPCWRRPARSPGTGGRRSRHWSR